MKLIYHNYWYTYHNVVKTFLDILFLDDASDKQIVISYDGNSPLPANVPVVYFQVEWWSFVHPNCQLSITHHPTNEKNVHLFNFEKLHIERLRDKWQNTKVYGSLPRFLKPKKKFCCFVVKRAGRYERELFFDMLLEYKKVDSLGPFRNNVDFSIPTYEAHDNEVWDKYLEILSEYKFMICFENRSQPRFLTEKLYTALNAGVVPIYWGCPLATEVFNPDRFLMVKTYENNNECINEFRRVIQRVIELDHDDIEYDRMIHQPCVLNVQEKDLDFENRIQLIKNRIQEL